MKAWVWCIVWLFVSWFVCFYQFFQFVNFFLSSHDCLKTRVNFLKPFNLNPLPKYGHILCSFTCLTAWCCVSLRLVCWIIPGAVSSPYATSICSDSSTTGSAMRNWATYRATSILIQAQSWRSFKLLMSLKLVTVCGFFILRYAVW